MAEGRPGTTLTFTHPDANQTVAVYWCGQRLIRVGYTGEAKP